MTTMKISREQVQRWRDPVVFCSEVLHDPETRRPLGVNDFYALGHCLA